MRTRLALGFAAALLALVPAGGHAAPSKEWFTGNDSPAWSPDGTSIAFTSFRKGTQGEIYVMRADGTHKRNLTNNRAYDDLAAWSPDGAKIAFTSNRDGNDEIYVMNADGTGQKRLTDSARGDYAPSWSPDGRKLAFYSNRDGNSEIYTMNVDGSGVTRLTTDPAADHSPDWGSNGKIAFVSTRSTGTSTRTAIWVMDADGGNAHQLTPEDAFWSESRPVWSPDATKLAFVSTHDFPVDNTEIYEMNQDGTGATRITHSTQHDDWPTWSPDAKRLAFSHGSFFEPEIYRMNADGTALRLISRTQPVVEVAFLHAPVARGGKPFSMTLGVATGTGAAVKGARTSCAARVRKQTLRVAAKSFGSSRARCAWLLPRSASGNWMHVTIAATLGTSVASEDLQIFVF